MGIINRLDDDSLMELYMFEATTLLDRLDSVVARTESTRSLSRADDADIRRIFDTLKGSSDLMRFDVISDIVSAAETIFERFSAASLSETSALQFADIINKVSLAVRQELRQLESGEPSREKPEKILSLIADFNSTAPAGRVDRVSRVDKYAAPDEKNDRAAVTRCILHIYFYEDARMENVRAYLLVDKLKEVSEIIAVYPDGVREVSASSEDIKENGCYIALETKMFREQLETMLKGTLSVESVSFASSMPGFDAGAAAKSVKVEPPASRFVEQPPEPPASRFVEQSPEPPASRFVEQPPEPSASRFVEQPPERPANRSMEQPPRSFADNYADNQKAPLTNHDVIPAEPQKTPSAESAATRAEEQERDFLMAKTILSEPIINPLESYTKTAMQPQSISEPNQVDCFTVRIGGDKYNVPLSKIHELRKAESGVFVLTDTANKRACLLVDEVIGKQTVVYGDLPTFFDAYKTKQLGFSGYTIDAAGEMSLMLDPSTISEAMTL